LIVCNKKLKDITKNRGFLARIDFIIANKIDFNVNYGEPLKIAVNNEAWDIVEILLNNTANIDYIEDDLDEEQKEKINRIVENISMYKVPNKSVFNIK